MRRLIDKTLPTDKKSAIICIVSVVGFCTLYVFYTSFFINMSIVFSVLFPMILVGYIIYKMLKQSISILIDSRKKID